MNLREFLKEEREERKERRKQQKQSKKKKKTPEQKRYTIFSIIFTIIIVCVFIFSCSSNTKTYTWDSIIGLTDEMKSNLEKDFNVNDLYFANPLSDDEIGGYKQKFISAGIDINDEDNIEEIEFKGSLVLSDREMLSMFIDFNSGISSKIDEICAYKLYAIGENFYEKILIKVSLSKFNLGDNLPVVYLSSVAKLEVQSRRIALISCETKINNLTMDESNEIFAVLNKTAYTNISELPATTINNYMNMISMFIDSDIELYDGGIIYVK